MLTHYFFINFLKKEYRKSVVEEKEWYKTFLRRLRFDIVIEMSLKRNINVPRLFLTNVTANVLSVDCDSVGLSTAPNHRIV